MSKAIKPGVVLYAEGFAIEVMAVAIDPSGTQAAVKIRKEERAKEADRPAFAPGLASQLVKEALDPLTGARHMGYIEGLLRAAEMTEAHGFASGRGLSVLIRNHAEVMRKGPAK